MFFENFNIGNHDEGQALKGFELAALILIWVHHDQIFVLFKPFISDLLLLTQPI